MIRTTVDERERNKKLNDRRYDFPCIYISGRNREAADALSYWRENRKNVSDEVCQAVIDSYQKQVRESANNNMQYYMDEHQQRLSKLPRITEYSDYVNNGGKDIVSMWRDGQINDSDLTNCYQSALELQRQIRTNPKALELMMRILEEEIKRGTKE